MTDIAVFDVDGTLVRGDSLVPFLAHVRGRAAVAKVLLRQAPGIAAALAGVRSRDKAKQDLLRAVLRGTQAAEVDSAGREFAVKLRSRLRDDVVGRLRWHQGEGHRCLLVSASLACYLHPLGELLGCDAVLCTRLQVVEGVLTGRLDGANCRGKVKVERLTGWCASGRVDRIWAYGDSKGDAELLAHADVPYRVGKRRLPPVPLTVPSEGKAAQ